MNPESLPTYFTHEERGVLGAALSQYYQRQDCKLTLKELEGRAILRALVCSDFALEKAALLLGISRTTLYRRVKELGSKIPKGS